MTRDAGVTTNGRYLLRAARILSVATVLVLAVLFASAGSYLQALPGLDVHGAAAVVLHVVTGLTAIALWARWFVIRNGVAIAVVSTVLFVGSFVQAALGESATLGWHVSGSLALTVLAVVIATWAVMAPDV